MNKEYEYSFGYKITLSCCLILLLTICLNHLLVLLSFIIGHFFLPWTFPLSVILAVIVLFILGKKYEIDKRTVKVSVLLSFFFIVFSLLVSGLFLDLSWDGQWYHQSAIYNLAEGWNPFSEPIRKFNRSNDLSIIHFPKGSWYMAASIYSTFGFIEAGKALNFIVLIAASLFFYIVSRKFRLSKRNSFIVSSLIILNPVVWSEIATYLVDGLLFLYLSIYIAALFSVIRKYNFLHLLIGIMAIVGLLNVKFTGIVFLIIFSGFGFMYILLKNKALIFNYIGFHTLAIVLGLIVFGFNPYVSNLHKRGNPLYPILGSKEYLSQLEQGKDGNEKHETPLNMKGKSLPFRLFYAHFGKPGNAPYDNQDNAELAIPFISSISSWKAYRFHETRIAGFGPFFSGILILSILYLFYLLRHYKSKRLLVLIAYSAIISSLLISKHFWWARFAPQIWLIPIIPMLIGLYSFKEKKAFNYGLIFLIMINALIVLFIHIRWEALTTLKVKEELLLLKKENKSIQISPRWFKKSIKEKLVLYDINYEMIPYKQIKKIEDKKYFSNVPMGYPGAIPYIETDKTK
ncbi:hypothetical protein [uncultured Algibacter sp.]|uniref:hypothetical protein n=1 Tax=uncultured Algibacter sp. TaxID=298659 RepID=UPI00262FCC59|nr:hypothetical protein [uncultured Algibacter sp.]